MSGADGLDLVGVTDLDLFPSVAGRRQLTFLPFVLTSCDLVRDFSLSLTCSLTDLDLCVFLPGLQGTLMSGC